MIVDPSAASFIEALRREGFQVVRADNDVADGIRVTADLLKRRRIVICGACADCLREMETYCWDDKGRRDAPKRSRTTPWTICGTSPWIWRRKSRMALRPPGWRDGPEGPR